MAALFGSSRGELSYMEITGLVLIGIPVLTVVGTVHIVARIIVNVCTLFKYDLHFVFTLEKRKVSFWKNLFSKKEKLNNSA